MPKARVEKKIEVGDKVRILECSVGDKTHRGFTGEIDFIRQDGVVNVFWFTNDGGTDGCLASKVELLKANA